MGRLSDVGQAYGAVSAVVSGLALLGVAVSLVIQQRQNRMTEESRPFGRGISISSG
jgi:hypothetical protein